MTGRCRQISCLHRIEAPSSPALPCLPFLNGVLGFHFRGSYRPGLFDVPVRDGFQFPRRDTEPLRQHYEFDVFRERLFDPLLDVDRVDIGVGECAGDSVDVSDFGTPSASDIFMAIASTVSTVRWSMPDSSSGNGSPSSSVRSHDWTASNRISACAAVSLSLIA